MIGDKLEAMVIYEDSAHVALCERNSTDRRGRNLKYDAWSCVHVLKLDEIYITRLGGYIQYREDSGDYTATVRRGFLTNEGEAELIRAAIATFNDYKTMYFERIKSAMELEEDTEHEQLPF